MMMRSFLCWALAEMTLFPPAWSVGRLGEGSWSGVGARHLGMGLAEQGGIALRRQRVAEHPYRDSSLICTKRRGTYWGFCFLSKAMLRNPL